jgi:hypothetical protein
MKIPRYWARARCATGAQNADLVTYGWSDTSAEDARAVAAERLSKLSPRFLDDREAWLNDYDYPRNPLREEILNEFSAGEATNIVTRNSYGALILNTDRVIIVDADIPLDGFVQLIKRLFGGKSDNETAVCAKLKAAAVQLNCAMRIYRTRAGFRAIVTDRLCAPDDAFATQLFDAAGADPQYVKLCKAQKSYRARLTPKPWRIGLTKPPNPFPRESPAEVTAFEAWLASYGTTMQDYSTCRWIEDVGSGHVLPAVADVLKVHDALTGALEGTRELA